MTDMEQHLQDALRRTQPPAGFAERVLRRAAEREPQRAKSSRPFVRWAAAAALAALLAGAAQHRISRDAREERLRGEAAKQQVLHALRVAGGKLQLVQDKVKEIGS